MWLITFPATKPTHPRDGLSVPVSAAFASTRAEAIAWARGYLCGNGKRAGVDLTRATVEREPDRVS